MLCTILPNPSIDFPKSVQKKDIDSVRQALDSSKVVVRSCANIPHSIFLRHRTAFENLLLVEPNAEKNKQNRKRKRFWGRKPRKYPLYFFPNEKTVCLPTFFVLGLTNGRYRKHLCSMGSPLTTKQKTKQPKLNLYGYQESVAEALLQRLRRPGPQGAQVVMGCGLGKTFFTIECIRRLGLRTLIVTHQDNISSQWGDRLAYGLPACTIGRVQQDVFDVDGHGVVICMIHTLCKRPFKPGTFSDFGLVVFDEVHHICAEMFSKCLRHLPCRCRIGLTATPPSKRRAGTRHQLAYWSTHMQRGAQNPQGSNKNCRRQNRLRSTHRQPKDTAAVLQQHAASAVLQHETDATPGGNHCPGGPAARANRVGGVWVGKKQTSRKDLRRLVSSANTGASANRRCASRNISKKNRRISRARNNSGVCAPHHWILCRGKFKEKQKKTQRGGLPAPGSLDDFQDGGRSHGHTHHQHTCVGYA